MRRQFLVRKAPRERLQNVVSEVCGIQAQVLTAAELALRARVDGIRQQDVRDALWKDHSILKTWCMRGTLHLLSTADLPLYVGALTSKLESSVNWLRDNEGIAESETKLIISSIKGAFVKNRVLTRELLSRTIERNAGLPVKARRQLRDAWGTLLRPSAYRGELAFGPNIGAKVTFVNPRLWTKRWEEPEAREAFRELLGKFFETYGPTDAKEFSHWWGGLLGGEKSVLKAFLEDLEQVRVMGKEWGFMPNSAAKEAEGLDVPKLVRLLPSFDSYGMFYSPRDAFVSRAFQGRIFSQEAGWIFPSLVVDGVATGVWRVRKAGSKAKVDVEPFRSLTEEEKDGVREESEDVGRFLGVSIETKFKRLL
jgi:hypothetical protein